jgi:hypothetical protein
MQNDVMPSRQAGDIMEAVITKGDLARLTPQERVQFYKATCDSVGLNPLTRPLEFITLSGRLVLYARRDAADQLRKINGISIEVVSQKADGDMLTVHVRARDKTGRSDEDFGVVSIAGLRGEARANATLKCITKAKRRVTLSIAGLGFLDETEVEDIPAREHVDAAADLDQFAAVTGDAEPPPARDILAEAREVAAGGTTLFREFWAGLSPPERDGIRQHMEEFQRAARAADDPFGLPTSRAMEEEGAPPEHLAPAEPPPPVDTPRAGLEIAPPMKGGKRDWRTWAIALLGTKVKRCTSSNELADLLGANDQNLEEARAALAPADLDEMERIIAEQWQKVPT